MIGSKVLSALWGISACFELLDIEGKMLGVVFARLHMVVAVMWFQHSWSIMIVLVVECIS